MTAFHDGRFRVNRVQKNVVARVERRLLTWMCRRLPSWVAPDHLTFVGILGAVLIFVSYAVSRSHPAFLWLASFGFVVHWFGDSLDGSLARFRHIERPLYGYFLDHTVDAICNLIIMVGLGLSLHVRMDVALFALIGYYLLCIYVFINNHLSGVMHLSFLGFGPTELRIGLIGITTTMYFVGHAGLNIDGVTFTIYDVSLLCVGVTFVGIFVSRMIAGIAELREPAPAKGRPASNPATHDGNDVAPVLSSPAQSVSKNPSNDAK